MKLAAKSAVRRDGLLVAPMAWILVGGLVVLLVDKWGQK